MLKVLAVLLLAVIWYIIRWALNGKYLRRNIIN